MHEPFPFSDSWPRRSAPRRRRGPASAGCLKERAADLVRWKEQATNESGRFWGIRGKTVPTGAGKLRAWLNLAHHHPLRFINFAS